MVPHSNEDNYLTIQLLSFDKPGEDTERFYFLEMSTLQATTLLSNDEKIISYSLSVETPDKKYMNEEDLHYFKTIGIFNTFFQNNPEYNLFNCDLRLQNGLEISSHDDGEVSIEFRSGPTGEKFILNIFERFNLNRMLIHLLKSKPAYCFAIDEKSRVISQYINFDDYIVNRNK